MITFCNSCHNRITSPLANNEITLSVATVATLLSTMLSVGMVAMLLFIHYHGCHEADGDGWSGGGGEKRGRRGSEGEG